MTTKTKKSTHRRMRFETWEKKYKPVLDESGDVRWFETYGDDIKHVVEVANKTPLLVWTDIDSDGSKYGGLCEGYHLVNRNRYAICQVPYDDSFTYWVPF